MAGEHVSDLESVDIAFGNVVAEAYEGLGESGPSAYQRFLKRDSKHKIFRVENATPQDVMQKIAKKEKIDGKKVPDLPVIAYYRELGIVGDMNQQPVAMDVIRAGDGDGKSKGISYLQLSSIPLTLTYSVLFIAWDRPSLDKLMLAWFCFIAPLQRKTTRFLTPYQIDGEIVQVPSSISAPRQILASAESIDKGDARLWAGRCQVEVNTQAIYGKSFIMPDETFIGRAGKLGV